MDTPTLRNEKVWNVTNLLKYTYSIVPIVAGLDKFSNLLVNWENYLNPLVLRLIPVTPSAFMHMVGIIEVAAGILVLINPRVGGYVVMSWLMSIVLNLVSTGMYYDIAVRDLAMSVGAYCLAKLAEAIQEEQPESKTREYARQEEESDAMQPTETMGRHQPLGQLDAAL